MKVFTKKNVTQKIVITLVILILTTFSIPKPVQADWGGKIAGPFFGLVVAILDGAQHMLEWSMLGITAPFMYNEGDSEIPHESANTQVDVENKLDGTFYGIDAVNIPVIQYTPEEIFSNRVPALDINFINPSVKTGDSNTDEERNVAIKLQPIIASWYNAIRMLSLVGLLSVLVYIGIRILLTSIAAEKAKYKKMLMDWVVAVCLVFALHYIMSITLTLTETVTALINNSIGSGVVVNPTQNPEISSFSTNLMGYVRFMTQSADLTDKIAFVALYLMLVIYSVRFTWVYLKRVVNMAFLTLIAPMVALTYPIDKVSDGKAQAFSMWIKEFMFNALIQPLHLLLYIVLLGSATELSIKNPLYAIVCLGFIIAAEKLMKQMFGFGKASGGTLGSLAGAAGVTAMASKMLTSAAKGAVPGGGGKDKIRTKGAPEREGKDAGINKPFKAFEGKDASNTIGANNPTLPEDSTDQSGNGKGAGGADKIPPPDSVNPTLDDLEQQRAELYNQGYTDDSDEVKAINDQIQSGNFSSNDDTSADAPKPNNPFEYNGPYERTFGGVVKDDWNNFLDRGRRNKDKLKNKFGTVEGIRGVRNDIKEGIRKRAIGAYKAAPTALYKGARGTLKTAARVAAAATLGGTALAIGATTGDGDKAVSMALGAAGVGFATGDNMFEAMARKKMPDKSVVSAYRAGKEGNAIDARNAQADKEYLRSSKFDDFYEKYYKDSDLLGKRYSKSEFKEVVKSYRQAGITSEKDIKKALKLEDYYYRQNDGLSEEDRRRQVQTIVDTYNGMDSMDRRAFTGDEAARKNKLEEIKAAVGGNEQMARQIFQGYLDYRNQS